jgi:POT family proton-dependent oligopeptide transporter
MSKPAKHPIGLYFLFFAEMWERFGYYLMIGIFQLYLTADVTKGGWGMERGDAADIYGTFIAFVFLTPFIGGLLADRRLGYRTSIVIGGILMGIGYCLLAIKTMPVFYTALFLIILGNGFFKPNISTLLGNLYNEEKYKQNKDAGYNIFYMGINIGALTCNFIAAFMRHNFGWEFAFISAGVGMFIGVLIFLFGNKHYKHADHVKPLSPTDIPLQTIFTTILLPAVIVGIGGWFIPGNIFGSDSTDAFIFACLPVSWFYGRLYARSVENEKKPIGAMYAIFLVVIIFWAVFKQNGTALTTWAELYTDRKMPQSVEGAANTLRLSEKIQYKKDSIYVFDEQFRKIKDANGSAMKCFDYPVYFKNIETNQLPPEKEEISLISTEIFQSVNPGWVVVLTPLVIAFWAFLRRKKLEPLTPVNIALGLFISGLSPFVMVAAVYAGDNGSVKADPLWLLACYGVITVGELFLSPMGLSMVSKLSPARLTSLMMGGWFLSTSIGNKLSGILAKFWDNYDNKALFFIVNAILLLTASALLFFLLKRLNKVFKEYMG